MDRKRPVRPDITIATLGAMTGFASATHKANGIYPHFVVVTKVIPGKPTKYIIEAGGSGAHNFAAAKGQTGPYPAPTTGVTAVISPQG